MIFEQIHIGGDRNFSSVGSTDILGHLADDGFREVHRV